MKFCDSNVFNTELDDFTVMTCWSLQIEGFKNKIQYMHYLSLVRTR